MIDLKKLPVANLRQNVGRTAGLSALVALLAFVACAGSLVIGSLQNGVDSLEARIGADVLVLPMDIDNRDVVNMLVDGIPSYFYMDASILDDVRGIEGVEQASPQYFLASASAGCCSFPVQIIGYDEKTDFTIKPWIARTYKGEVDENQVVVGCNVFGKVGEEISLYDVRCTIVAKLDETGTQLDNAVFASDEMARRLTEAAADKGFDRTNGRDPEGLISCIQVKVADGYDPEKVVLAVYDLVDGSKAIQTGVVSSGVAKSVAGLSRVIGTLVAVIWILAAGVLFIAFTLLGKQRTKEFATLRVIGASRKTLSGIVVKESAIVAVIGSLVGVAVALVAVWGFNSALENALGLPFLLPGLPAILAVSAAVFALCLAIGPLASAASANWLSKVDVGQILREE